VENRFLFRKDLKDVQFIEAAEAEAKFSGIGQIQLEMVP
jgi:hypothetical protein